MKQLPKITAVVMWGILTFLSNIPFPVNAATSQKYENLTYMNYGGWIEITGCDASAVSVEIPKKIDGKTVRDIGKDAFSGCSALTQITIPDCVEKIKASAFNGCAHLTEIDLPDHLNTIGLCAFANCGFTEVTIPDTVVAIDRLAFAATPLTAITIPKNVETIGEGAFFCGPWGRGTLTEINVDAENTSFSVKDGVLFNYDQTELLCYPAGKEDKEYIIPETVTALYADAFDCCVNLEHITISGQITVIPEKAFCNCINLKEITIPDSVMLIDKSAFAGCSQVTSVYMPKSVESIRYYAFGSCTSLTDVYYAGTEADWNAIDHHDDWITKANIHYQDNGKTETVKGDVNADHEFNVLDVVLLQRWLSAVPDTHLNDWKAADFTEDDILNIFDLVLMKKALLAENRSKAEPALIIVNAGIVEDDTGRWRSFSLNVIDTQGIRYRMDSTSISDDFPEEVTKDEESLLQYVIENGQQSIFIQNADDLHQITEFVRNASQYQDCEITYWDALVEHNRWEWLFTTYTDEDGVLQILELCRLDMYCEWLDHADVQEFVTMLIQNGYFSDKDAVEPFLKNQ